MHRAEPARPARLAIGGFGDFAEKLESDYAPRVAIRILIAGLLVAAAAGAGLWLHGYRQGAGCYTYVPEPPTPGVTRIPAPGRDLLPGTRLCRRHVRPSWADPVALGGGIVALALGAALIVGRRPHFAKPS